MPPKVRQGVPQKTAHKSRVGQGGAATRAMRAKSLENHAVKARIEAEKALGGIEQCDDCGTPIKCYELAKGGAKKWSHLFMEAAAKHGPHLPRKDNA